MIDKQLLDRFLRNECTEEERRLVTEFLENHPEGVQDLLPEAEFSEALGERLSAEQSEHSFQEINGRLRRSNTPFLRWGLVAASVVIAVFGAKWLMTGNHPSLRPGAALVDRDVWVTQINNTQQVETLSLPDGSSAEISPGSQIKYRKSLASDDRRIVAMEGEGQFRVTGDQHRPFMVQSGPLTTTVLGTWFSVQADPDANQIKVHLYSGKVQVGGRWKMKDSVLVLKPGDELVYNKEDMLAVVNTPKRLKPDNVAVTTHRGPQLPAAAKPEWYMFGGQSLTAVFDQLSDYYGVQINYFPSDIKNRYFTGKFSKQDSLEVILQDIALLHGLALTKEDGIYIFRKKDH